MAKKKAKRSTAKKTVKNTVSKVWDRYGPVVVDFLERESTHILTYITRIAGIKRHLKKMFAAYSLMLVGVFLLLLGLSTFLTTLVTWPAGVMHMVVGLAVLIIASIIVKS